MDPFIPYARQSIISEDLSKVSEALGQEMITRGPLVKEFEEAIASYCGAKYAVSFNSASSALAATYFAADVQTYDRVLTTPNTFIATINGAIQRQARHIFLDIDCSTGNLDLDQIERNINSATSRGRPVLVPVHFSGIAMDMAKIDRMIKNPDTVVIEDAAHALGSLYPDGLKVGSCKYSHMTVFSFHPAKIMTTGEGGMVTTNNDELFHRLQLYRNNGIERDPKYMEEGPAPWYYEVVDVTGNFHLTDFQAALGLSQLTRLDDFVKKRRELVQLYRRLLADAEHIRFFETEHEDKTAYHLFVVQIDFSPYTTTRKEVMESLKQVGIGTQVHYIPLYRHPYFVKRNGDLTSVFPEMESYYSQALSLPLYYDLKEEEVVRVVQSLKKCLGF